MLASKAGWEKGPKGSWAECSTCSRRTGKQAWCVSLEPLSRNQTRPGENVSYFSYAFTSACIKVYKDWNLPWIAARELRRERTACGRGGEAEGWDDSLVQMSWQTTCNYTECIPHREITFTISAGKQKVDPLDQHASIDHKLWRLMFIWHLIMTLLDPAFGLQHSCDNWEDKG